MNPIDLVTRRNKVLAALVRSYIDTVTPVASLSLSRGSCGDMSSATIRNVMAELEKMGLIWQPHPSAGRIPTQRGYRYYVDSLMAHQELSPEEKEDIRKTYRESRASSEVISDKTPELLSVTTHCVGMILLPSIKAGTLKRLRMVPLAERKILLVLMASSGMLYHATIETDEQILPEELEKISRYVNTEFFGLSMNQVEDRLNPSVTVENDPFFHLRKRAYEMIKESRLLSRIERISIEGVSQIAEQPEFRDVTRLTRVLGVLEDEDALRKILTRDQEVPGVKVRIGRENESEMFEDCTVITASYRTREGSLGSLGVVGPTRMAYSEIVAVVDYMAEAVTDFINDLD